MQSDARMCNGPNETMVLVDYRKAVQDYMTLLNIATEESEAGAIIALLLEEGSSRSLYMSDFRKRFRGLLPYVKKKTHDITTHMTPGHEGLEGNDAADRAARDFTHCAAYAHDYHDASPGTSDNISSP